MLADCFVGVLGVMGFAQGLSPGLRSIWENCLLSRFS